MINKLKAKLLHKCQQKPANITYIQIVNPKLNTTLLSFILYLARASRLFYLPRFGFDANTMLYSRLILRFSRIQPVCNSLLRRTSFLWFQNATQDAHSTGVLCPYFAISPRFILQSSSVDWQNHMFRRLQWPK